MSIRFENVTKHFGSKIVLDRVSFQISSGEIHFIIGKSGVGKSVTLKQIIGLMKPNSGHIYVDDQDVTCLSSDQLISIRKKCGMVFQYPALLDSLTIYENIGFALHTGQITEEKIREIVLQKLALVHLETDILDYYPPEISYGMQKRVSLARALAPGPSYLLFDEPTTGLDPITTNAVCDLIFDLSRKLKVTSVVVSHDMASALRIADQVLVLDEARVLQHASIPEIKKSSHLLIQEFLAETMALSPPEVRADD